MLHHDGGTEHVAVVGAEGLADFRAHTVQGLGHRTRELTGHLSESLCLLRRDQSLLGHVGDGFGEFGAGIGHDCCTDVIQTALLLVVQQGNLLAQQFVATDGIYLRQILGAHGLAGVCSHLLLQS